VIVGPVTSLLDEGRGETVSIGPVVDELRVDEVEDLKRRSISLQRPTRSGASTYVPLKTKSQSDRARKS
jgi:hypothetical protein